MTGADHFSAVAGAYARYRPTYPDALFAWLASVAPGRRRAWDCGTGNGQAALGLARHVERVIATDPSAAQLAAAAPHPRVTYRQSGAEASGLEPRSCDLVIAAQALHWFDVAAFYEEARRVLVPGGLLAVWCYGRLEVEPATDEILHALYADTLGPWWPPERAHVDAGYRTLPFPAPELDPPAFHMEASWTLDELLGYLGTWSASARYRSATGEDAAAAVRPALLERWGDPARRRVVRWPLSVRAAYPG